MRRHLRHRRRRLAVDQRLDVGGVHRRRRRASPSPSTATARSRRGPGAHDVIEALGLRSGARRPSWRRAACARRSSAFLFAPAHHAATKHVVGPRKEVGFRTIFNLLGPLTNPAGVRAARQRRLRARALRAAGQGPRRARARGARWSSTARGGLDEFAPAGATFVAELTDGEVTTLRGRARPTSARREPIRRACAGGAPADNARIALEVLRRRRPGGGAQRGR